MAAVDVTYYRTMMNIMFIRTCHMKPTWTVRLVAVLFIYVSRLPLDVRKTINITKINIPFLASFEGHPHYMTVDREWCFVSRETSIDG